MGATALRLAQGERGGAALRQAQGERGVLLGQRGVWSGELGVLSDWGGAFSPFVLSLSKDERGKRDRFPSPHTFTWAAIQHRREDHP